MACPTQLSLLPPLTVEARDISAALGNQHPRLTDRRAAAESKPHNLSRYTAGAGSGSREPIPKWAGVTGHIRFRKPARLAAVALRSSALLFQRIRKSGRAGSGLAGSC